MATHKKKKKKNEYKAATCCPTCGASIQMVPTTEMNFHFDIGIKDGPEYYWRCSRYPLCDTYISADKRTNKPSGLLAGPSLRHKRIVIHNWQNILVRGGAYNPISFRMACAYVVHVQDARRYHTRELTEAQCDEILRYFKNLYDNDKNIHRIVEENPESPVWKEVHGLNTGKNHKVSQPAKQSPEEAELALTGKI